MFLASVSKTIYNSAPGADSTITGLVTLLAVAEAIGKVKEDISKTDRPIMFTFFNGVCNWPLYNNDISKVSFWLG